jgi:hypothetical protein
MSPFRAIVDWAHRRIRGGRHAIAVARLAGARFVRC